MTKNNRGLTKEEIEKISEEVVGKTFGELGDFKYDLDDFDYKGGMGVLMEENVFHYDANNDSNPDFSVAKIELKVTPIKKNKNGTYSAKERLVLNIINYMEEYKNTFETSSFWHKNENLNLMFYLWEEGVPRSEYKIIKHLLYTYPEEDLIIIKQDWETIINKIKKGLAHEISEADTLYLGACTKGANKESVREQPFSDILAKQRAYCLKASYMTNLVRTMVMNEETEKLMTASELKEFTFEEIIHNKVRKYIGKTQEELKILFDIDSTAKNINELLICRMFEIKSDLSQTEEFKKANIIAKTVRVQYNGSIKESLPFPAFKFKEIVLENWEESTLRSSFESTKFMFFVFKEKKGKYEFVGVKLWNISIFELDNYVSQVWYTTKQIINAGDIVCYIDDSGKRKTNFPGMKDNPICHVRPHARNAEDVFELPVTDKVTGKNEYTKHSFWINATYLSKILKEF